MKLSMCRSSPPGELSKKNAVQIRSEPTGATVQMLDHNKVTLQLYSNHTHARMRPRESTAHPQNTSSQENTSGRLLLYLTRVLKDLNYKKLQFTVAKRNLLTLKNK